MVWKILKAFKWHIAIGMQVVLYIFYDYKSWCFITEHVICWFIDVYPHEQYIKKKLSLRLVIFYQNVQQHIKFHDVNKVC